MGDSQGHLESHRPFWELRILEKKEKQEPSVRRQGPENTAWGSQDGGPNWTSGARQGSWLGRAPEMHWKRRHSRDQYMRIQCKLTEYNWTNGLKEESLLPNCLLCFKVKITCFQNNMWSLTSWPHKATDQEQTCGM